MENFFTEDERAKAVDMIARIRDAFASRIPTRDWLSDQTRAAALEKLDAITIRVGYPDAWIDYGAVEIGADPVANLAAIAAFETDRMRAKFGKPVEQDQFADPRATLPIIVNAAYNPCSTASRSRRRSCSRRCSRRTWTRRSISAASARSSATR